MMSEETQQPVPQIKSTPYQSPMNAFGGSILLLTNPENELYKLELTLRSAIQDADGVTKQLGEPLLNDEGVTSVVGQVQAIINQVTIMSNLHPKEIPLIIDFLADTLAIDLMINRVKYAINNPSARYKIYTTALTSAYICLKRASEEGERRFWKGSQQDITTRIEGPTKKTGAFGKMMGWGN